MGPALAGLMPAEARVKVLENFTVNPVTTPLCGRVGAFNHPRLGLFVTTWFRPDANANTIAHEALHATFTVLADRGMSLKMDSEEAYAYYLGHLVQRFTQLVRRRHKPRRPARRRQRRRR